MKLISTRNPSKCVSFQQAVLDCMPEDGGLYVPSDFADLRRWLLYTDENTTFASIAGALTSSQIKEEFSPIISETIATKAFSFEPVLKKLDDNLFALELFHTPTGSHKDFGISYLINCIETILTMQGKTATFLDATIGELGSSVARFIRGKKNIKAVLLYPKGKVRGLQESDYIWNGGNVLPLELDGNESDCHEIIRKIFCDRQLVKKYNLTVANTANIGRLLPQTFFYPFAFSRLKKQVNGDIFYAMPCGNYSNLVAGLYSWRFALPLNGFLCPSTDEIKNDLLGNCTIMDSMVSFSQREKSDPASPSNLERLEEIFNSSSKMLRHFIYPSDVTDLQVEQACRELFVKYNVFADYSTGKAYSAIIQKSSLLAEDDASAVLVMRDHPALSSDYIRHTVGEAPALPENIMASLTPTELKKPLVSSADEVVSKMAEFL